VQILRVKNANPFEVSVFLKPDFCSSRQGYNLAHLPALVYDWTAVKPKRTGHSIKLSLKSLIAFLIIASESLVGAQTLQTLCYFNGTNGIAPNTLALGNDGNFYGPTCYGGITNSTFTGGMGTVFKVTTNGTLTTLVSFNSTNGAYPNALTLGSDGNFYGTTEEGGNTNLNSGYGYGTVFKMTTNGTLTPLVFFGYYGNWGYPNGADPTAALTLGNDGNFYGTTEAGGNGSGQQVGTVFKVTILGMLTTLVYFKGTNGVYPMAALTLGNDGNFYGTTSYGGSYNGYQGYGTVFKVTTNGTLTTLVSFNSTNGAFPMSALTLSTDGNFYGTTRYGGITNSTYYTDGMGTVFKVTTNGTLTTLVFFNYTNGALPNGALTLGSDGNFYGTTEAGGNINLNRGYGYGTVFKVTTNGTLTTLVSFACTNGAFPMAGLTLGTDGNFYATTMGGGIGNSTHPNGLGTVFRLLIPPVVPLTLALQFVAGYPQLNLAGTLGNNFVVQYSTNLAGTNWINLLSLTNLSASPYGFIDPAGVDQPARFYRAFLQ
jgi:uncharacterized repeat protein (TIGR03803 family)